MKTILVTLTLLILLSACSSKREDKSTAATDTTVAASSESYYTCPMHPFVRSDRPGVCPVCGMALVKRTGQGSVPAATAVSSDDVTLTPAQRILANVQTTPAKRQSLVKEIEAVGVVSIAEPLQATIAARFGGRVEKVYANYTGVLVRKGEPLFELYSPDVITASQDYLLASNSVLIGDSTTSPQAVPSQDQLLAASKTRLSNHFGMTESQISQLERSKQVSSSLRFDSPIQGTVLMKNVQEGQYVDEGMVLYQLADLSKVWIYLDVYEQNMSFVKVGQNVALTTDAYPGETFHGRVTFIDPTMDGGTRTIRVRTEFSNSDYKLKPNMYVAARIDVPTQDVLVIPTSAILQTGTKSVVWVEVRPNTFESRTVIIGTTSDSQSEILDGLMEGDIVAVSGGFLIDSESQLSGSNEGSSVSSHAGHSGMRTTDNDPMARPSKDSAKEITPSDVKNVNILVHGGYSPDIIKARLGQKLELHFFRDEDSECSAEVVFKDFNVKRFLPVNDTTTIEITPSKTGTIEFECGQSMLQGKIIVSK